MMSQTASMFVASNFFLMALSLLCCADVIMRAATTEFLVDGRREGYGWLSRNSRALKERLSMLTALDVI